jgi:hypothetical protein
VWRGQPVGACHCEEAQNRQEDGEYTGADQTAEPEVLSGNNRGRAGAGYWFVSAWNSRNAAKARSP